MRILSEKCCDNKNNNSNNYDKLLTFCRNDGGKYHWVRLIKAEFIFFEITSKILDPFDPFYASTRPYR